jgi:tetratricopeptide (TPR) repeat protein
MEFPRLRIIHFMIAAVVAAFGLALFRATPEGRAVIAPAFVSVILFSPLALLLIRPNLLKAALDDPSDDPEILIACLERGLARPPAFDGMSILRARRRLMELYMGRGRHADAIDQGRALVKLGILTSDFEARVRLDIAYCFDCLGRYAEAEEGRRGAEDCLDGRPEGYLGWRVQGELLVGKRRFRAAAEAYERAMELSPPEDRVGREWILRLLAVASSNTGRYEETIGWAEQLLSADPSAGGRYLAHWLAGECSLHLLRLDEAELHCRRAHEAAVQQGDARKVSAGLALSAELHLARGGLAEAEALCLEAESCCPGASREALVSHTLVLWLRGLYAEALARVEEAGRVGRIDDPPAERWAQALLKRIMAALKAELGRLDEARADLREAAAELGSDPRHSLATEAVSLWLRALRGDREETIRRSDLLLRALEERDPDPVTWSLSLENMGRALLEIGECEQARSCWERLLERAHLPVSEPIGYYYLGECHSRLGNLEGALEAFRRATASGIDSHHARLAAERLRELSPA